MDKRGLEPVEKDPDTLESSQTEKVMTQSGNLLTFQQLSAVNYLFHPAVLMDWEKSCQMAGYENPKEAARRLQKNKLVRSEVEKRLVRMFQDTTLTPEAVLNKMWSEANNHDEDDSSPTARVMALTRLMQHFELLGQKGQGPNKNAPVNVTINIDGGSQSVKVDGEVIENE